VAARVGDAVLELDLELQAVGQSGQAVVVGDEIQAHFGAALLVQRGLQFGAPQAQPVCAPFAEAQRQQARSDA
jgi:hypothetical protein